MTWSELETGSPEIICDNSTQGVQASSAKLPSLSTHNYKNKKMASLVHCLVGIWFPLKMACHLGSFIHSEDRLLAPFRVAKEKTGMLTPAQNSLPAPDFLGRTPPTPTTFKSYLGTPALEPMPEDCRECRRFLAVASGWASANCWMAACRALREAASLRGGMKGKCEHVDVAQGNMS